uniref:Uncharacterized protein n=2 Tax=Guillardia theta TaxID=55529 RepID=A0A7S4NVF7_GUITH
MAGLMRRRGGLLLLACLASCSAAAGDAQQDTRAGQADHGSQQKRALSAEEQRVVMNAMYTALLSFKAVLAVIVFIILGINGACCLCPKSEQERLAELLERQNGGKRQTFCQRVRSWLFSSRQTTRTE